MKLEDDYHHILNHTKPVWEQVAGKTIFLTGGTGFFGKWLLDSFLYANDHLRLNAQMIVLSRNHDSFLLQNPKYKHPGITFLKGDIRDFKFPEGQVDYIIHAATDVNVAMNVELPLRMYDTIVAGTRHILELARVKNVAAILHTSSGAVYGKQPSEIAHISEDYNGSPDIYDKGASYGEGKRTSEMLCNMYYNSYMVNSKIARCFAFVGPYLPLDTHFAIGNFINDVVKGNKIIINGDGTPYRSYMYASDLVIWLWNILVFGQTCRPYNVGSDEDVTIKELAKMIAVSANHKTEVEIRLPKSNLPPARYVPNVNRAKEELNLCVHVSLKDAIQKTIEYYS